jgi:hypothetical protein
MLPFRYISNPCPGVSSHALTSMFTGESLNTSTIVRIGVALCILCIIYQWLSKTNKHIPPGPPRYPLIGNLLNFPKQGWADIFPKWNKEYGV